MKKKGQFFLIAAFVVIGILLSIGTIYNAIQTNTEETHVYDLSEELAYESYSVIDYGIYNSLTQTSIQNRLTNLTNYYAKLNPSNEILTIYGDESDIQVVEHTNIPTGSVGLETGSNSISQDMQRRGVIQPTAIVYKGQEGMKVRVILNDKKNISHSFDIKKGQNFFLVIKKQRGQEDIISTQ